ncbi:AraC family transcriptional regulator [Ciceribacter naphthalenivorans]|uniref:AraC family transcriptional regulator n=3 Tax=Pseudomonadota TaxID=1224 RepID=A0A512HGL8_9HYPH|nr:AraC family transcriptional regulator [Ciceribacter naphthalenivorans]GLR22549.1 AraC family transcriptional regulator [Ciceribacter naphthalenivorans]GLT05405.1 AraC family transcriptional regulator [Sphingomonas psychrolutea]
MSVTHDRLRLLGGLSGLEHIEAAFTGEGFAPHRHDTYGIGVTLSGVQIFHYRGALRASLPGNIIVLHPDELHDGAAGTETGLVYRMIYVAPERIAEAQGIKGGLPFVTDPVVSDGQFRARLGEALVQLDDAPSELAVSGIVAMIADGLRCHSDVRPLTADRGLSAGIAACRDHLSVHCTRDVGSQELEAIAGLDRYTIARQFRRAFGTSPHRYLVMRRIELARRLMHSGTGLAEAAIASGFADQAHFTRHFKAAYGITPGRWLALLRN